jgi:alkyldihydroxyacetonephosphate synthase
MQTRFRPSTEVGRDLLSVLPEQRISQGPADRLIYSRDMWPKALLSVRDNKPSVHPPDYVVWPETTLEVAEIVRLAARHGAPLIPYGGGSGVCGGAMAIDGGGIVIDLKRMKAVLKVSPEDHLAAFQAGLNGQILEDQLNLRGLTLGHFPSSIFCSTLGGWLAARSAGQLSSRYGKIEDMVQAIEVVLGDGRIVRLDAADEPDLIPILVGSEGTLGIITEATMRVHPLPDYRIFRAYEFPRVAAGCEAMRRVMQRGLRAGVMRVYDEMDTFLARPSGDGKPGKRSKLLGAALDLLSERGKGGDLRQSLIKGVLSRAGMLSRLVETLAPRLTGGCLAILGLEGEPDLTDAEAAVCHAEYTAAGGRDLGEGPGLAWYKHRYDVSFKMSPVYASGGFVDTMEVASTWDRLMELYAEVRKAISPLAFLLAHFSHAYPEGCSIYFTFAASAEGRVKSDTLYDEIWRSGLKAVTRAGGTISHHHGVGQAKAAFMEEEHGSSMAVYRRLKALMDPAGILNPGKMGL